MRRKLVDKRLCDNLYSLPCTEDLQYDVFSCEKHLVSGVTVRISFRRSQNDFVIIGEADTKHYALTIDSANRFVRKMTFTESVVSAIEKTLLKTPAAYRYNEVISKTYLATRCQSIWKHKDIFTKNQFADLSLQCALVKHS